MKYNCEIVQDLLPLYQDGVASDASVKMVEEHLKECSTCPTFLQGIQKKLPVRAGEPEPIQNSSREYLTLAKRIRKTKWYWRFAAAVFISALIWTSLMYSEGFRLTPLNAAYASNILQKGQSLLADIKIADDKELYLINERGLYREIYVTYSFPFWKYQYVFPDYHIPQDAPLQLLTQKNLGSDDPEIYLYMVYTVRVNDENVAVVELGRKDKLQQKNVQEGMVSFVWDESDNWDGSAYWEGMIKPEELIGTAFAANGTPLYTLSYVNDEPVWLKAP